MRVLIAAGEQNHWLEHTLTEWGYEVVTASDGTEAWHMLSQDDALQLVVLDLSLSGIDGVEICRRLREAYLTRPNYVILLTGKANGQELSSELEVGADAYITKPIDVKMLRAYIQSGVRILELQGSLIIRAQELEQEIAKRTHVEQSLERRNMELYTINTVAQTMSSTLELDRLLDHMLDALQQTTPYDAALVSLLPDTSLASAVRTDTDSPTAWIAASRGLDEVPAAEVGLTIDAIPLMQRVIKTHSLVIVRDVSGESDWLPLQELGPIRSWLGVPLLYRDRVTGVLAIGSFYPNSYDQDSIRLVSSFAQQAALAIENSRLYGQTRAQLQEAVLLHSVTAAFSSTLDVNQMLPYATRSLCEILHATSARIFLLEDDTNTITAVTHYAASEASEDEQRSDIDGTHLLPELPIAAEALARSRPTQFKVTDPELSGPERSLLERYGIQAALYLPMVTHGRKLGLAVVWESRDPHQFTQGEIAIGQTLTHQAAIAMEHARLFTETERGAQQLEALYRTSRALSSSLEQDYLMRTILEAVCRTLACKYALIATVDPESESIRVRHGLSEGEFDTFPAWIDTEPYPRDHPYVLSEVWRTGDTEIIEEWDARFNRDAWEQFDQSRYVRIFVPIRMRDGIIGVVEVGHDKTELAQEGRDHIGEDEIQTLTAFIDQAAVALDNARLFEAASRRVHEMQFLHDVSLAAATGTRLQDTLQRAAEAIADEMDGASVALLLLESEGRILRLAAGTGYPRNLIGNLCLTLNDGISGWVAKHGQPLIVANVQQDPRYYRVIPNIRSELCVPLIAGPFIIGALNVASPKPNAFTNDDMRLLSTLSSNIALLVERARLFTEVEEARIELQQRASALENANVGLQELDRLKDQFLANVSHELRTPLNSVIGFSEVLLKGRAGEINPDQRDCVHNILVSGEHLLDLINDILDLSKIEAGRMVLELQRFEVPELMAEVQTTVRPMIENKSQVLTADLAEDLPSLTADRFRIKQVLLNLLSNATKFTPAGGHITLSCSLVDPATMIFSVTDTGIGIKAEEQEIIFEEFRQASGSSAGRAKGTGLGLAISNRLIELHGSGIWVESEYGRGATFSFLLPIDGFCGVALESSDKATETKAKKKILVVEDDHQFSNLLSLYLRQEGYDAVQHYSGDGVVELVRETGPALITLDLVLPERSGWDVLRDLKSTYETRDIPILVISVLEDKKRALSLGATEYLVKPVHLEDLHALLSRMTTHRSATRRTKVLLIDDDPEMLRLLEAMIPAQAYEIVGARDGEQGLSLVEAEQPDIVLLDLMLPGISGAEVLQELRVNAQTADLPVVVLTAKILGGEEQQNLAAQVQGLMKKTALTPRSLLAELRRLEKSYPRV
jgi:signal transduction histidine kinase/DNA-binding response OmpR family regulator